MQNLSPLKSAAFGALLIGSVFGAASANAGVLLTSVSSGGGFVADARCASPVTKSCRIDEVKDKYKLKIDQATRIRDNKLDKADTAKQRQIIKRAFQNTLRQARKVRDNQIDAIRDS